jgi:hypothetical protein
MSEIECSGQAGWALDDCQARKGGRSKYSGGINTGIYGRKALLQQEKAYFRCRQTWE